MADVLVFAEHKAGHFPKTTLIAVNAGIELAKKRGGGKCIAVIAGEKIDAPAAELAKYGMSKVVALDDPKLAHYLADLLRAGADRARERSWRRVRARDRDRDGQGPDAAGGGAA